MITTESWLHANFDVGQNLSRPFTYNGNKAGVDVVLIQRFLLSYANYVVLMLTGIFQHNFHKKEKMSASASLSLTGVTTKPTAVNWSIAEKLTPSSKS